MSNIAVRTNIINEMTIWRREYYSQVMSSLARVCTCPSRYISCIEIDPRMKPDYDAGYVFFGPNDILLAEIRWNRRGENTDLLVYDDRIDEVRTLMNKKRAAQAREKSVNRTKEQAAKRKQSFKKGLSELTYVIKRNYKDLLKATAFIVVVGASIISMNNVLHPDYINPSYDYGYQAVSDETHRTSDNQGYWYDYSDIARTYDSETMDFDSFVYGTYKHVGWNQESRYDCMDSLFSHFYRNGYTSCSSFLEYCDSKGACVEKDGRLVIDAKEFSNIMEEYMESLNHVEEFKNAGTGKNRL